MIFLYAVVSIIGIVATALLLPYEGLLLSVIVSLLGGNLLALATGLVTMLWRSFFLTEVNVRQQQAVPQGEVWC